MPTFTILIAALVGTAKGSAMRLLSADGCSSLESLFKVGGEGCQEAQQQTLLTLTFAHKSNPSSGQLWSKFPA